jgi:HlyD family secretion protein
MPTPLVLMRRLLVLLAVVAAAGVIAWRYKRPAAVPVVVGKVDRGRVERSIANTRAGTVKACRRARLAPAAGGQITSLRVHEGDRVAEGQVLLELWNGDTAAEARAAAEQFRTARLRAEQACLSAATAGREAERARKLHDRGLLADDQLDRANSLSNTERAACQAVTAEVGQSQAHIELARANLTRTVLRAPFAGIVAKVTGELGEFTTPSPPGIPTPPAIDLIDDQCMYVSAPIDEVDVARVRTGQLAYITIDALPGQRFVGRVRRIAPYVLDPEKQARTVDVEVEFRDPNDAKALLVGYSADVEIVLDSRDAALRIPTQALLEGNRVLVYKGEGAALEQRKVETGISNWQFTEARSGLAENDQIVLSVEREGVVAGAPVVADKRPQR